MSGNLDALYDAKLAKLVVVLADRVNNNSNAAVASMYAEYIYASAT